MPASVHQRVVGPGGLGSAATQLMRAVSWHDKADVSVPVWRRSVLELSSRSEVVERQVVVGVRAGGSLEVHAAGWLVLAKPFRAKTRRTEARSHSPRPSRSMFAAGLVGDGMREFGSRRLGPLFVAVAPLVARRRVCGRRRCAFGAAAGPA